MAPEKPVAKTQAKRRPGADELDPLARKQKRARAARSVLDVDAAGLYRPRTRETRAAYEAMLSKIQESLGDQPEDILRGAADEVLSVIKAEGRTAPQKKKELEGLLGSMTEERFGELHAISDLIGDFTTQEEREKDAAGVDHDAEEFGVAVEFDEEEEEQGDPDDVMAEVRGVGVGLVVVWGGAWVVRVRWVGLGAWVVGCGAHWLVRSKIRRSGFNHTEVGVDGLG